MRSKFLLAAVAALVPAVAGAQEFRTYGTVGEWQIAINERMGPGCLAIRKFVNPTSQVQMGIDATSASPTGYLAIYVEGVERIQPGEEIPASFDVDGQEFKGTFIGQQTAGYGGAFVPVNSADFIYDLANKETLTISYGDGFRVIVPLDGTDEAFAMLRTCQGAQ